MEESRRKSLASHPDPESCMASHKAAIEALTGAYTGRVLSYEVIASGAPTSFSMAEGNTVGCATTSTRLWRRWLSVRLAAICGAPCQWGVGPVVTYRKPKTSRPESRR
jgi:hypothetical protein